MKREGVYTTARVQGGRVERLERHAGRLRRDAERLGFPVPERPSIEAAALAAVREASLRDDGVVRIEWSRAGGPPVPPGSTFSLRVSTRPLGPEPRTGRAATARTPHPGPGAHRNTKALDVPAWDAAREERVALGVDEVLLFDAAGRLVEGSRTNLLVVTREGEARTPALRLGPVEGLGLEIVREFLGPDRLRESDTIDRAVLAAASELIAINVVRGATAIVELDGSPIGGGVEGPQAARMREIFGRR